MAQAIATAATAAGLAALPPLVLTSLSGSLVRSSRWQGWEVTLLSELSKGRSV